MLGCVHKCPILVFLPLPLNSQHLQAVSSYIQTHAHTNEGRKVYDKSRSVLEKVGRKVCLFYSSAVVKNLLHLLGMRKRRRIDGRWRKETIIRAPTILL